jgi:hypothetical protein
VKNLQKLALNPNKYKIQIGEKTYKIRQISEKFAETFGKNAKARFQSPQVFKGTGQSDDIENTKMFVLIKRKKHRNQQSKMANACSRDQVSLLPKTCRETKQRVLSNHKIKFSDRTIHKCYGQQNALLPDQFLVTNKKVRSTPVKNMNGANSFNKTTDPEHAIELASHRRRKSSFRSRVNQFKRNFRLQNNHASGVTGVGSQVMGKQRVRSPIPIAQKFFDDFNNSGYDSKRQQYLARRQKLESLISEREIDEIRQRIAETIKC